LVSYDQASQNQSKILSFLESFGYKDVPLIPVSAQKKLNIDALIEAIETTIPTPIRDMTAKPFMQVLRSFDVNKQALLWRASPAASSVEVSRVDY